ncbi:G-protein alpha subunit [Aphelenchoides avenae]|nr:G-protein alpha subunit [Aphelenchus avenae]
MAAKLTGACCSLPRLAISDLLDVYDREALISKRIDAYLAKEKKGFKNTVKLLLLGPAESGKTTLLKQMKIIHLNGYSDAERRTYREVIYGNILQAVSQLLDGVSRLELDVSTEYKELSQKFIELRGYHQYTKLTEDLHAIAKRLWELPVMRGAYECRSNFQLLDCAKAFLDDIDRMCADDYCPTIDDILNCRVVTMGVNELQYKYGVKELRIVDVSGQRSERRKWVSVFDNVNAIFFIAAISEYDQKMMEDNETNRLTDAIRLFNEIGNIALFDKASMILFLNKKDLFEEKIKRVPLKTCFPEYNYRNDFKNTTSYIIRKFRKQIANRDKPIYTHLTCTKDTSQMQFLTNSMTDMIIANILKECGSI